jgi:hypothetical protein
VSGICSVLTHVDLHLWSLSWEVLIYKDFPQNQYPSPFSNMIKKSSQF